MRTNYYTVSVQLAPPSGHPVLPARSTFGNTTMRGFYLGKTELKPDVSADCFSWSFLARRAWGGQPRRIAKEPRAPAATPFFALKNRGSQPSPEPPALRNRRFQPCDEAGTGGFLALRLCMEAGTCGFCAPGSPAELEPAVSERERLRAFQPRSGQRSRRSSSARLRGSCPRARPRRCRR